MLLFYAVVLAGEPHGIKVYKGAVLDKEETTFGREIAGADIYCYRTKDSIANVIAYYKRHPGLIYMGGDVTHAIF
jgi:hypothetical protein